LLVQGTSKSKLEPFGAQGQSLTAMSYRVTSQQVRCLLSEKPTFVDLHGYCDFDSMLAYRLDTDVALVYVSALSVIKGTGNTVATVELIQKVGDNEKESLLQSLAVEWKTALTNFDSSAEDFQSPNKPEYWERSAKRIRRMDSELQSPDRR
jgi:hypothetical protein